MAVMFRSIEELAAALEAIEVPRIERHISDEEAGASIAVIAHTTDEALTDPPESVGGWVESRPLYLEWARLLATWEPTAE